MYFTHIVVQDLTFLWVDLTCIYVCLSSMHDFQVYVTFRYVWLWLSSVMKTLRTCISLSSFCLCYPTIPSAICYHQFNFALLGTSYSAAWGCYHSSSRRGWWDKSGDIWGWSRVSWSLQGKAKDGCQRSDQDRSEEQTADGNQQPTSRWDVEEWSGFLYCSCIINCIAPI